MNYIPVHKKTGQRYPAITQADKDTGVWSRYPYGQNGHFRFEPVPEPKSTPPPTEIKKTPETAKETDPLKG